MEVFLSLLLVYTPLLRFSFNVMASDIILCFWLSPKTFSFIFVNFNSKNPGHDWDADFPEDSRHGNTTIRYFFF